MNMDEVQQQFEHGVADRFFEWFAQQGGPNYSFVRRAHEAPDLVYACNNLDLQVEITAAYYDGTHAEFLWKYARGAGNPPIGWQGVGNPHKALAQAIIDRVEAKCEKRYGLTTLLLIEVPPGLTSAEELAALLTQKVFPSVIPFAGVYVAGRFPITSNSSGGYRVLPIKELPANHSVERDARKGDERRLT
jgi:hypothetical protein